MKLAVKMAEEAGYRDLKEVIAKKETLKAGDKVYAVGMKKMISLFQIGKKPLEEGMAIRDVRDWITRADSVEQTEKKWNQYVKESIVIPASPYGSQDDLDAAARAAAKMDVDLVVMDCIGYNIGMKERFQKLSGKRVILSRTLAVRVMMELLS